MTAEKTKTLLKGRQKVINGFESKIFPIGKQEKQWKGIKITPKQMLQSLLIALAQVKAGDTSENLLNEIHQLGINQTLSGPFIGPFPIEVSWVLSQLGLAKISKSHKIEISSIIVLARCRLHFWSRTFVVLTDNSAIFAWTSKIEHSDLHLCALIY